MVTVCGFAYHFYYCEEHALRTRNQLHPSPVTNATNEVHIFLCRFIIYLGMCSMGHLTILSIALSHHMYLYVCVYSAALLL